MSFNNILLRFIICVIFSLLVGYQAKKNNKDPIFWSIMGLLFGVGALIVLFILIRRDKRKAKKAITISPILPKIPESSTLWYFLDQNKKEHGPMSLSKLYNLYKKGDISNTSYIWNEKLDDWMKLEKAEFFDKYFV